MKRRYTSLKELADGVEALHDELSDLKKQVEKLSEAVAYVSEGDWYSAGRPMFDPPKFPKILRALGVEPPS